VNAAMNLRVLAPRSWLISVNIEKGLLRVGAVDRRMLLEFIISE
jgi:hypothetical protein